MTTGVLLRRAEPRDAEALSTFAARVFWETYADDTAASDLTAYIGKNFRVARQHAEIVDPCGAVFLAVKGQDGRTILGYAQLVVEAPCDAPPLLNRLYIEREFRGTGLAGRLLEEVRSECRRRGAAKLRLTVFEKNTRAISFYKQSGFAVTGFTTFRVGYDVQRDIEMATQVDAAERRHNTDLVAKPADLGRCSHRLIRGGR
ncbi:N-acetyltransferase family protein [Rhizobium mongolense]|uniref:N-acetyltransferase family protein n=1 Tax=Rhizobium mongolense TaxID=57676 RepID=UPI0034A3948A